MVAIVGCGRAVRHAALSLTVPHVHLCGEDLYIEYKRPFKYFWKL